MAVPTPEPWRPALPGQQEVQVLRLCDGASPAMPGWCTAAVELSGPELEVLCGGVNSKQPTHAAIWRQGHLLHFGFEPSPSQCNATGRKLLLNAIAYIARFTTDRPILRVQTFVDPKGSGAPSWRLEHLLTSSTVDPPALAKAFAAPWSEAIAPLPLEEARAYVRARLPALRAEGSKFTFDDDALALGVDLRAEGALDVLVAQPGGAQGRQAQALLHRLLPAGPPAGTTLASWRNWLQTWSPSLCFDPHSHVWRIDPLASARGVACRELRGPARADGDAVRDPGAVALADLVAMRCGGARTLEDLQAFGCRQGDVHFLWDRRQGFFRAENHAQPAGQTIATPWQVAILDTAADEDLLLGGGPDPRPRVSARSRFRQLVEFLFLPLLLAEPGTSLQLLPDDEQGCRQLAVRLSGRGLDPRKQFVLHVEAKTGELRAVDVAPRPGARATRWTVEAWADVGPLRLPVRFVREDRNRSEVHFEAPSWNRAVPPGLDSAPDLLLGGG